jgi:hypothetical protein
MMTWTKEQIHGLLDRSPKAVGKALLAIAARQTAAELATHQTTEANGMGFNKFDAEFLTDVARKYRHYGSLTPRQLAVVRNKIKRYWRQLIEVANQSQVAPPALQLPSAAIAAAVPERVVRAQRCVCEFSDGEPTATCPPTGCRQQNAGEFNTW